MDGDARWTSLNCLGVSLRDVPKGFNFLGLSLRQGSHCLTRPPRFIAARKPSTLPYFTQYACSSTYYRFNGQHATRSSYLYMANT